MCYLCVSRIVVCYFCAVERRNKVLWKEKGVIGARLNLIDHTHSDYYDSNEFIADLVKTYLDTYLSFTLKLIPVGSIMIIFSKIRWIFTHCFPPMKNDYSDVTSGQNACVQQHNGVFIRAYRNARINTPLWSVTNVCDAISQITKTVACLQEMTSHESPMTGQTGADGSIAGNK